MQCFGVVEDGLFPHSAGSTCWMFIRVLLVYADGLCHVFCFRGPDWRIVGKGSALHRTRMVCFWMFGRFY